MGIAISFLSLSTRGWFTIRALWLQQNWYLKKRIYIFLRSNSEKCFAFVTVWEVIFLISARGTLAWKKISKVLRYVNVPGKCNALGSLDKNVAFKKFSTNKGFLPRLQICLSCLAFGGVFWHEARMSLANTSDTANKKVEIIKWMKTNERLCTAGIWITNSPQAYTTITAQWEKQWVTVTILHGLK